MSPAHMRPRTMRSSLEAHDGSGREDLKAFYMLYSPQASGWTGAAQSL